MALTTKQQICQKGAYKVRLMLLRGRLTANNLSIISPFLAYFTEVFYNVSILGRNYWVLS